MKIVLLGTGGYFPTPRRQTACVMLPEVGVVLDAGTGLYRLSKHRQTETIDIFLSHAHLDHITGLTCLLNIVPPDVLPRTTVYGEAAKLEAVRAHLFAESIFPIAPAFNFAPLSGCAKLPSGGTLTSFPLAHPGGSLGFRLDWPGHSLAYVTDTTASERAPYISQIRGVDLLVHESFFPNDAKDRPEATGHSTLTNVAKLAVDAAVGRLVLIHIDPMLGDDSAFDIRAARSIFPEIVLGEDELEFEF